MPVGEVQVPHNMNMRRNMLLNFRVENRTTLPSAHAEGLLYYDSQAGVKRLKYCVDSGTPVYATVPRTDLSETVSGVWNFNPSSGSVPFVVDASKNSPVANLNADRVDSFHASIASVVSTVAVRDTDGTLSAADPTSDSHLVTLGFMTQAFKDRDVKEPVDVASTANVNIASAPSSIDGYTLVSGDRVLLKDQSTASENGIYVFNGVGSAMTRATDADEDDEVTSGMQVFVLDGTAHIGAEFTLITKDPITVGTTGLSFVQTGGQTSFQAGRGIVKSGNTFHFAQSASYSVGDIAYADSASTMTFLTAVATGNVLKSGGPTTAPLWGKVDLTTDITGTLPVTKGGTGTATQFTSGSVIFAGGSGVYTENNTKFFWDNTNFRLGLGAGAASYTLDVAGTGRFTSKLGVGNSSRTAMLDVRSDTGEAFRVDVAGAAYRIVVHQTGVNLQGTVNLATFADPNNSHSVVVEDGLGNLGRRTINAGVWGGQTANRVLVTSGDGDITTDVDLQWLNAGQVYHGNNSNSAGHNFVVNTTNKDAALFAYGVQRSGVDVGGVRIDGRIQAINGSSEYPGFTFLGDADTGFYNSAADSIGVVLGGASYVSFTTTTAIFNSAIKVGIGTSLLYNPLTVNGAIQAGANTSTVGSRLLVAKHDGANGDYIPVLSTEYSSGAFVIGYGAEGKNGAAGFVSTYDSAPLRRSALVVSGGTLQFVHTGSAVSTLLGSDLTMTTVFETTTDGDLVMRGGRVVVRESDDGNDAAILTRDADEGYLILNSSGTKNVELRGGGDSFFQGGRLGVGGAPTTDLDVISNNANPIRLYRNGVNASLQTENNVGSAYFGINTAGNACIGHVLDQTNAPFQIGSSGVVKLTTVNAGSSNEVLVHSSGSLIEKRTINAGVWTTNLGANRFALTNSSGELTSSSSFTYSGSRVGINYAVSTIAALRVGTVDDAVTVNSTTYEIGLIAVSSNCYDISTGVTDSGYRAGMVIEGVASDADFKGSLAAQYGLYIKHGASTSGVGAVLQNSYGLFISSEDSASADIQNLWGLYQSNSAAKNYFAGKLGIGVTPGASQLTVSGSVELTGVATYLWGGDDEILVGQDGAGYYLFAGASAGQVKPILFGSDATEIRFKTAGFEWLNLNSTGVLKINRGSLLVTESDSSSAAVNIVGDTDEGFVQIYSSGTQKIDIRGNGSSYFNGGPVGFGTVSPDDTVDIVGNLRISSSKTDLSNKTNRIRGQHYTNAEEPVTFMYMNSFAATSIMYVGGGSSLENAVTQVNFYTAADNTTTTGTLRMAINSDGSHNFISPMDIWNTVGPDSVKFARETEFGGSASYKVLQIGEAVATRAIAIGADVSANLSLAFTGNEVIFPVDRNIITPNVANNAYLGLFGIDSSEVLHIGSPTYNVKGGGRMRVTLSTGALWVNGELTLNTINTSTTDNNVLVEAAGAVKKRMIDSRVWGSSLVDGSGSSLRLAYWSDGDTLTYLTDLRVNANGQIFGGFGGAATTGTLDWNDSSNARPGNGYTLLQGIATNGPSANHASATHYFHPFSFEYNTKDGTGNMTQFAIPYNGVHMLFRYRFSGTWTGWYNMWNSGNDGAGSGLDADLLDGQHGSYYTTATNIGGLGNSRVVVTDGTGKLTSDSALLWDGDGLAIGTSVSALLTLGGGATTKAPLKFTAGPLLTTEQVGAMEFSNETEPTLYFTPKTGVRRRIALVYETTIGNGAATSFAITHNLGASPAAVSMWDAATGEFYHCDYDVDSDNQITVSLQEVPASNSLKVKIVA